MSGNTFTPMTKSSFGDATLEQVNQAAKQLGIGPAMEASDIARPIVWLLSENSLHVNGVSLTVGEGAP
jgi:chanoclavine-I dehydrogenase